MTRLRSSLSALMMASALGLAIGVTAIPSARASEQTLTGEIDGALFTIAKPEKWNGNLLLIAHGYRPEDAPRKATLDTNDAAFARLLGNGWMIAASSYRRNGMIIRDAIADLDALRDHIEKSEGAPHLVILLGYSMGGAIVTLMAENEPDRFQGAVAVGAALLARDATYPLLFTDRPKIPIIFLTNRSELEQPGGYVERAAKAPVVPALWTVAREGHVNVNSAEVSRALQGLITWITSNDIELRRDVTAEVAPTVSTTRIVDGAAHGTVDHVTETYGNIFTTFRASDFAALGIQVGDTFELAAAGKTVPVVYGTNFSEVKKGGWIAFLRAEGVILIARNFANAATTAGVKDGDELIVRALKK